VQKKEEPKPKKAVGFSNEKIEKAPKVKKQSAEIDEDAIEVEDEKKTEFVFNPYTKKYTVKAETVESDIEEEEAKEVPKNKRSK